MTKTIINRNGGNELGKRERERERERERGSRFIKLKRKKENCERKILKKQLS